MEGVSISVKKHFNALTNWLHVVYVNMTNPARKFISAASSCISVKLFSTQYLKKAL